ncbi:MAG: NosD domain-containing protein, partial [Candidatus Thorarchaeota archaeon]
ISGNEINGTETAIYLYAPSNDIYNITINGNYLHDNSGTAICVYGGGAHDNYLENNKITNCRVGIGLFNTGHFHDIIANTIYDTYCAIQINGSSAAHRIILNQIASPNPGFSNTYGIYFSIGGGAHIVENNTFCRNELFAIYVHIVPGPWGYMTLRYNNFIQNNLQGTSQIHYTLEVPTSAEYNYWDEWTTPDIEPDGIVDVPYDYEGGQDIYPLVEPSGTLTCHYLSRVNVTYPNGGETLNGIVTANWTSSSSSFGYEVLYDVWFSSDSGSSWAQVAENVSVLEFDWDTTLTAGGNESLIKVTAHCSDGASVSDTSDDIFTIEGFPLQWVQTPEDQLVPFGEIFRYDLNATTGMSIDYWWLDDYTNFIIDQEGIITNITILNQEDYIIHVFVNDTTGHELSARFSVIIDFTQPHGPIVIDGDADFASQALSEGWPGDGSSGDPYTIQYYGIDMGGSSTHCISISNTRVNFTIRKCTLTGANVSPGFGINLDNVTFGEVSNNILFNNFMNIYVWDSHQILVDQNICYDSFYSISIRQSSSYNTVSNNNCSFNSNRGVNVESSSHHNLIINNTCNNNLYGIVLYRVTYIDVINNTLNYNINDAIHLRADYCKLENNTASYNDCGVFTLDDNEYSQIINNVFTHNEYGILLASSFYHIVANNSLAFNGVGLFSESTSGFNDIIWNSFSSNTVWNCRASGADTYDFNYWSGYTGSDDNEDCIGDTPYLIPGGGAKQDWHPLMMPPGSPIIWKDSPVNVQIKLDESFYYDLNVTGWLDYWLINDFVHFNIDQSGVITNATVLSAGFYPLTVSVNDIFGNIIDATFTLRVIDPLAPHDPIIIDGDDEFASTVLYESWVGDGTSESPYIIENLMIDRNGDEGHCISISNTQVHFIIRYCVLSNASIDLGAAIYLNSVANGLLHNNTCINSYNGIYLFRSTNIDLTNNTCKYITNVGIFLTYFCAFNLLANNTCSNTGIGIFVNDFCTGNTLSENTCSDTNYGILLRRSSANTISNNNCTNNINRGICLEWSHSNSVTDNDCDSNGAFGIVLYYSNYNDVIGNSFDWNGNQGVHHRQSDYNNLIENSCKHNAVGMSIHESSDYNLIKNNTCDSNTNFGVYLISSTFNSLTNNTFRYNR